MKEQNNANNSYDPLELEMGLDVENETEDAEETDEPIRSFVIDEKTQAYLAEHMGEVDQRTIRQIIAINIRILIQIKMNLVKMKIDDPLDAEQRNIIEIAKSKALYLGQARIEQLAMVLNVSPEAFYVLPDTHGVTVNELYTEITQHKYLDYWMKQNTMMLSSFSPFDFAGAYHTREEYNEIYFMLPMEFYRDGEKYDFRMLFTSFGEETEISTHPILFALPPVLEQLGHLIDALKTEDIKYPISNMHLAVDAFCNDIDAALNASGTNMDLELQRCIESGANKSVAARALVMRNRYLLFSYINHITSSTISEKLGYWFTAAKSFGYWKSITKNSDLCNGYAAEYDMNKALMLKNVAVFQTMYGLAVPISYIFGEENSIDSFIFSSLQEPGRDFICKLLNTDAYTYRYIVDTAAKMFPDRFCVPEQ